MTHPRSEENYWTPERMKGAKPMPLPTPLDPLHPGPQANDVPKSPGEDPAGSEAGAPEGDVEPDPNNRLLDSGKE